MAWSAWHEPGAQRSPPLGFTFPWASKHSILKGSGEGAGLGKSSVESTVSLHLELEGSKDF